YSQFEVPDSRRVFAVFEQPDLKAGFRFTVTAPAAWKVVSNSPTPEPTPLDGDRATWAFERTPRISSYITALIAGPYEATFSELTSASGRVIPLGVYARKSLWQHLDADYVFEKTRQGFAYYEDKFAYPYPFAKYDQLFVPEFNAGAMENAGAVTFTETYVFRSKVTDAIKERRVVTILHELAHMWFGDLVTMKWWNDLWLNESFAEWASTIATAEATEWTEAWTTFNAMEKTWAYRQDQLPSTHPIATDAPDVQTAEVNFDGITYAKGASVLKQLGAYVGVDAFLAGLRSYFVEHAYGNTTLADLLRALEQSSGRDLGEWSKLWLETAGISTLRPEFTVGPDGTFTSFEIVQSAPTDVATSNTLRPHRLAVGLYREQDGQLVRTERVELDVTGERTSVPELVGAAQPALLLVNDDDLTYCKQRLDETSLATLRTGGIAKLTSSLARALCWSAAWDMTRDGELATRDYIALVVAGAPRESDIGVMQSLTRQALRALEVYADPEWAPEGYAALAAAAYGALLVAEPGSDHQLAWAHALIGSARSDEHIGYLRGLLDGSVTLAGLALDHELRWSILQALSAAGALMSDLTAQFHATLFTRSADFAYARVNAVLDALEQKASAFIAGPGRGSLEQTVTFWAEARYPEQVWELEVKLPSARFAGPDDVAALVEAFHATHEDVFAIRDANAGIEIVGWSVSVACRIHDEAGGTLAASASGGIAEGARMAYFPGHGRMPANLRRFETIAAGEKIAGPAIIESSFTTVVVNPGAVAERRPSGSLSIDPGRGGMA
ncbi:MAG: aminopeptidase N, partial [Microbacterium sp.]|nr:aminopeptidase N [Microbacterium sp.]